MTTSRFTVRPFGPDDYNFVISTWLRSARDRSYYGQTAGAWARVVLARDGFFDLHRVIVAHLLESGTTLVVCDRDDPDTIVGWATYFEGNCVWAYTLKDLRKKGIWKLSKKVATQAGLLRPPVNSGSESSDSRPKSPGQEP